MSNESQAIVVQCAGCSAKLRMGGNARGKTVTCPKCGHQMKIDDNVQAPSQPIAAQAAATKPVTSQPVMSKPVASTPVVAKPVVAKPVAAKPVAAKPMAPASAQPDDWQDFQLPANVGAYQLPQPSLTSYPVARRKSGNAMWLWIGIAAAGGLLLFAVVIGLALAFVSTGAPIAANSTQSNSLPTATGNGANAPGSGLPRAGKSRKPIQFPELGHAFPFGDKCFIHRIYISREGLPPTRMNIFIPKGDHGPQSLPVVFEAPSGTNLLHGADVSSASVDTEYLPFTEAGMITVSFPLDGPMSSSLTPEAGAIYVHQLSQAYKQFVEADAGVANGSMAIDYVLQKMPQADPKRLYVWGHSSAATVALLLASKDTRISKCIAMAPVTDLNLRLKEMLTESSMHKFFPNLTQYFRDGSPITYTQQMKCPLFVAHARDDDNEPFQNTERYVRALETGGCKVIFEAQNRGGHYQELLDASIPKAIQWLKN